jgi:serine/threonine protein kinase
MIEQPAFPPSSIRGAVIRSEVEPNVRYFLERHVGEGGMGMAYLARRESPEGASPVVVKVVLPTFADADVQPELIAKKEAVALGRLNERVPPTPFVVRFVDAGSAHIFGPQPTPWIAIEYVHGGVEGTTLEDRVTYSIHKTGFAFDSVRAAHALRCLSSGLSAIHSVDVIHRDLTPGNVLCCGFGESEIFKISDFGVARAEGLDRTFAGLALGTVGYSAPESGDQKARPHSDVFSLACITYYILTGQHYFDTQSPADAARMYLSDFRQSVTEHTTLCPEIAERDDACRAIDAALARATQLSPSLRPQTAEEFAASVLPWLGELPSGPRSSRRLLSAVMSLRSAPSPSTFRWVIRSRPRDDLVVRSAAWDTDGHALVVCPDGGRFWNGQVWLDASKLLARLPRGMRFTRRYEAGGWLLGGDHRTLAVLDSDGIADVVEAPHSDLQFSEGSGRFDDLLVAVGQRPSGPPALYAMSARRWMKPLPLDGVSHVTSLQRFDDSRFLVGGRKQDGHGFVALYAPMHWELSHLPTPQVRSFISGASAPERSLCVMTGSDGVVLRVDGEHQSVRRLPDSPDLSAAALDILDREWVASLGSLWTRDAGRSGTFERVFHDPNWSTPFISMMADAGMVVAMTADGAIVEGRSG